MKKIPILFLILSFLIAEASLAQETQPTATSALCKVDTGDTSWILISTALVMLMTPGLALFYGGMVRSKNVLGTIMQSFIALGVITIMTLLLSLPFTDLWHPLAGSFLILPIFFSKLCFHEPLFIAREIVVKKEYHQKDGQSPTE
jgi:hypothetical protein